MGPDFTLLCCFIVLRCFFLRLTNHFFIFSISSYSKWLPVLFLACLFEWRVTGDFCLLLEYTSLQSIKGSTYTWAFHLPEEHAANIAQVATILHCVKENTIFLPPSLFVWLFSTLKQRVGTCNA